MAAANCAFRPGAETRAATQAAEMQCLLTSLTALQSLVAKNQEDANQRMQAANKNFAQFQLQMTQAAATAAAIRASDQAQVKAQFDLFKAAINASKSAKSEPSNEDETQDNSDDKPKRRARRSRKDNPEDSEPTKEAHRREATRCPPDGRRKA